MPAPRKYDQETRDRAVRMYQDRRRSLTSRQGARRWQVAILSCV
jgi:hypothetical protein